jgi:hypothetical protein
LNPFLPAMKTSFPPALAMIAAAFCLALPASAAVLGLNALAPTVGVEDISLTLTVPLPEPDSPSRNAEDVDDRPDVARLIFPNVFDLAHEKKLTFTGQIRLGPGHTAPYAVVGMTFDWLNPATGSFDTTDLIALANINPTNPEAPLGGEFTIPFCPAEVSIEFFLLDALPGTVVQVTGTFTHECLVPEPGETAALAGVALGGFALWRRRRP